MFIFSVRGVALTASFRLPEAHTFHQTLPLPPKTTIIGIVGAAKGLVLEDSHTFVEDHNIQIGVIGNHRGIMRDLWNYRKITGKEKNYTEEDIKNRKHFSVLIREYLFHCELTLFFGADSKEIIVALRESFRFPVYALTIGNSDDLLKILIVSDIFEAEKTECRHFEHTVLPGEFSTAYKPVIDLKTAPVTQTVTAPQVYLLPSKFLFTGEERRVAERKPFTFVGSPVELNVPVQAFIIDSAGVVLH